LHAQQQRTDTPASTPNGTTISFKFMAARYGGWLLAAFDSIPSSRYDYRPTPAQQSVGYVAQHLENANYSLCERLGSAKHVRSSRDSFSDSVKAAWPKDTLVARLRESFAFCDAAMARMTDARLNDPVPYGPSGSGFTALPSRSLLLFVTDLAEHYSQIAIYMRLIGLVPPSALPPKPRTAVQLPADLLSRYVGRYDLPPSVFQDAPAFLLDVTLNDGALYLQPRGRSPVRLWPESATEFFVKEIDAQITFVADAKGNVTGLVVHQNGENRAARKQAVARRTQ
jgi:hypothetical protein